MRCRAESEMTGNDTEVTIKERLCRTGGESWGIHTGVEAKEIAAVVERLKQKVSKVKFYVYWQHRNIKNRKQQKCFLT